MKTLILILTILGIASASADHHQKPKQKGKPHGKHHIDWKAKKEEFLKKFDTNKNGKIDSEEKKAIAEEWKKKRGAKKPHGKRPHGRKSRPDGKPHPQRGQKPHRQ
tara:strand:- start:805 stop:1122 length:318 start_codon:yes stop_codon:yes gene_type:complete